MIKIVFIIGFIITSPFVDAQELGNPNCDSLLLVSSWSRDNVKIYDGCDGEFIKDMAEAGVLDGPQAIFQDGNGDVIVVSESNHKLVKFDLDTLSVATTVVEPGLIQNPITVVKKDENNIYLGSYSSNQIIELNTTTWQPIRTILPANNGQVQGIDIGMALGPDGQLYVPGYDSDSILKVNPDNGNTNQFISSGANELDRPRTVLFSGNQMLVTAWGNQAIFSYRQNGQFQGMPVTGFPGAAGMISDGPEHILVTSDTLSTVRRYKLNDFSYETIVTNRSGGLAGATYVYRLQKTSTTTIITDLKQAWVTGVGTVNDLSVTVENITVTSGGAFGDEFNPDDIQNFVWGDLLIEFTGCHTADMTYTSNIKFNAVPFGSGGYPVTRLAMNPPARVCDDMGVENVNNNHWMAGAFYGGPDRNGEGFTIEVLENDRAIVTWYTYLPKQASTQSED